VLEVGDTVKEVQDDVVAATVDRHRLRLAQTPQAARREWLCQALERAAREGVAPTDEAAALERDGRTVRVVAGDPDNLKITTARDLDRARRGLEARAMDLRVGTGFDIHASGADRTLVLGGVSFPGEPGLAGHSDADVILHAAMDALLGAACLGDLGAHFPPGDPRFKDAASTELLRHVAGLVRDAGYEVVNVDLTLLAERPRIREHAGAMRDNLARCLEISADRVGLKATTLERLGALGRGEGIACQAVALLRWSGAEP
jgi:2-C-methyl-D-erythritol 4-phosphate cytidylyltransferase/2-C-methyl-D-erythritol 2,4-cyclodiphosphate synthase